MPVQMDEGKDVVVRTIHINGRIVLGEESNQLRAWMQEVATNKNIGRVDLDLRNVGHIDSAGFGTLEASRYKLASQGVEIVILNPNPKILEYFVKAGLHKKYKIMHTLQA